MRHSHAALLRHLCRVRRLMFDGFECRNLLFSDMSITSMERDGSGWWMLPADECQAALQRVTSCLLSISLFIWKINVPRLFDLIFSACRYGDKQSIFKPVDAWHLKCLLLWSLFSEGLPCFQTQTDLKELLDTLGQNVVTKKRKNVEILWLAGMVSLSF